MYHDDDAVELMKFDRGYKWYIVTIANKNKIRKLGSEAGSSFIFLI